MKCLMCYHENDNERFVCENCGADMYINERTRSIAIRLYNKGLVLAKERKLTEAAEAIKKSIYFDKFNISAHNVLGLLYYELGMIADALKQWAISASYDNVKNLATEYLAEIKENLPEMEKMNASVKMYNQGLTNVLRHSDDIAILQLKKAVELNPKFVEAANLLAFVYATRNDIHNAILMIDSVRAHDKANPKAISYNEGLQRKSINTITQRAKPPEAPKAPEPKKMKLPFSYSTESGFPLSEVISLVIGVVSTLALMFILIIPSIKTSAQEEQERLNGEISKMQTEHETAILEKDKQIAELTNTNQELASTNTEIANKTNLMERQQLIADAVSLNSSGKITEAAAILIDLDTAGFSDEEMSQYNTLKDEIFPVVAKRLFTEGKAAFLDGDNATAQTVLESGLKYGMSDANSGDAYYYLGRIAEGIGDIPLAVEYYTKTVDEFGDYTTQYQNAQTRLNSFAQ